MSAGLHRILISEAEKGTRRYPLSASCLEPFDKMLGETATARENHRNGHNISNRSYNHDIESGAKPVTIGIRQQNLSGTCRNHLLGPSHHVQSGVDGRLMGKYYASLLSGVVPKINGHDDALGSKTFSGTGNQVRS